MHIWSYDREFWQMYLQRKKEISKLCFQMPSKPTLWAPSSFFPQRSHRSLKTTGAWQHSATSKHPKSVYSRIFCDRHRDSQWERNRALKSERVGPGVLTVLVSMSQMEVRSQSGAQWPNWIVALFLYCIKHYVHISAVLEARTEHSGCCHCFENERKRGRQEERWMFFLFVSSVELGGRAC